MNLTPHALLFTIAAIGIAETAYLIRTRRAAQKPVCPIGQDCSVVLSSRYNRLLAGVHNDLAGLVFYAIFAVVAALLVLEVPFTDVLLTASTALLVAASTLSLIFIYLQARVIRAWCFWCLMSAATVGLMDLIFLTTTFV